MIDPAELQSHIISDEAALENAEQIANTYLRVREFTLNLFIDVAKEAKEESVERLVSWGPGLMEAASLFQKCDPLVNVILRSVKAKNVDVESTKALLFALVLSGDIGKPFLYAMTKWDPMMVKFLVMREVSKNPEMFPTTSGERLV